MLRQHDTGWSNPKVIAILAVVFLCGSAFGALGMREFLHSRMPKPGPEFVYNGRRVGFSTMKSDLNLTPEQAKTVSQVLDDFAKFYQNIDEERVDVTESGKHRILAVLDDSQKKRFHELFNEPPDAP